MILHWKPNIDRGGKGRGHPAFTLIEIMIAIAIVAIILAIGIPSVYQQMHKDSMRQALSDVVEACSQARARAVLDGAVVELSVRPLDRRLTVVAGSAAAAEADSVLEGDQFVERPAGAGTIFTAKLSDHIHLEEALVFQATDRVLENEVICKFYPNGTCDYMVITLASDQGERRIITTDVITGIADVEVVR